jgi:hypothetical protein
LSSSQSPLQSRSLTNLPSIIISEAVTPFDEDDESDKLSYVSSINSETNSIFNLELSSSTTPTSTLLAINVSDENNECDSKSFIDLLSSSSSIFSDDDASSIISSNEFSDDGYYSSCSEISLKDDSTKRHFKNKNSIDNNNNNNNGDYENNTLKPFSFIHQNRDHRNHVINNNNESKLLKAIKKYHRNKDYNKAWKKIKKYDLNHATPESKYWAGHYYIHNYNISGKEYEDDNRKNKKLLKNNKKAKDKLIQASELNHSVAQFELAHAIFEGRIKVEEERRFQYARELLEKSAENKYNMAIRRIAKYKREGSYGYERTKSVSSIELKSLEIKSENKNQFNSLKKKEKFHC